MSEYVTKDSGQREAFNTGAVRDVQTNKGRYDLLPFHAIERLAKLYERGAVKYQAENWRKGIPLKRYLDSALRHLCKFAEGYRDEDHATAVIWNMCCLLETEEMIKRGLLPNNEELGYLPNYAPKEENVENSV